jgi:hypothetical protein
MAGVVGVTQMQIEDEYYMIDLVKIAQTTKKYEALRKLELLNIVNSSRIEQRDYKALVNRYMSEANLSKKEEKFSRSKFEELRASTPNRRG